MKSCNKNVTNDAIQVLQLNKICRYILDATGYVIVAIYVQSNIMMMFKDLRSDINQVSSSL